MAKKCCICKTTLEGFGNNPAGAVWKDDNGNLVFPEFDEKDRCCDLCDQVYVIPGRIYRLKHNK